MVIVRGRGERVICGPGTTILAVDSLSLALLLGVELGSRPPTLDFQRYPFSFYYLPSSVRVLVARSSTRSSIDHHNGGG